MDIQLLECSRVQSRHMGHTHLLGQILLPAPPMWQPSPLSPALLGKEGFQGCQQATGSQAVGESDTSVNSCGCQAKELAHRMAQLLHTINDFPMLLIGKYGQTQATSDLRTNK